MLKTTMKYSVLALSIWGLSACSRPSPRVITIEHDRTRTAPQAAVIAAIKRPEIKEEILLGQNSKNPSLGSRVDVPVKTPQVNEVIKSDANLTTNTSDTTNVSTDMLTDTNIDTNTDTVPRNEVIERIAFPVEEYKYVKKRGRSTVSGKIYLENSHTSLKVKGQKIKLWLNPVTSYSRQWYEESHLGGYKLSKSDKRLYNYLKFTYSDRSGNFNFFGVPSGDYYLTGSVSCSQECGFNQTKAIRLVREISVGNGVMKVDLMKHVP